MHPMLLVQAASGMNNIINFIEGVGFREALSAIGDTEVKAAKLAMQNAEKARDVQREVTLAVGHLQSAHSAYRSIWQQLYSSELRWIRGATIDLITRKDMYILCLMALCYVYLNEFQLARTCVNFAKEAHHAYNWDEQLSTGDKTIEIIGTIFREPGKTIEVIKDEWNERNLVIDVESFSKAIEQLVNSVNVRRFLR